MFGKNPENRNIFIIEDPCFLCAGFGRIAIGDNKKPKIPESKTCPICGGKGFLKIKKGDLEQ